MTKRRIVGLALGSGSARGWAHIGVVRALTRAGIEPEIVCGSSIGAVVGAVYAAGKLEIFEEWARRLDRRQVMGYFDFSLRGGLIKGRKVFEFVEAQLSGRAIESLERPYAAVATDLHTGHEVWLRQGSLLDSLRASVALPGLVTPVKLDGRWLVDGGLVNPVPISVCRALGADVVIAVDLNTVLLTRRFHGEPATMLEQEPAVVLPETVERAGKGDTGVQARMRELAADLGQRFRRVEAAREQPPSMYEVIVNSLDIMQMRITRSRMAGDPPELLITPRLEDFNLLDFYRADEAITEGEQAVARALAAAPPAWLDAPS
jgi:NTE family protein